jgi:hypothetical protein
LTHSHASWSIAQGVNVLALSRRLGHARPSITLDVYSHLFPGGDGEIADALDGLRAATLDEVEDATIAAIPSASVPPTFPEPGEAVATDGQREG